FLKVGWGFCFQAEDGIRDRDVTGVQTCALPIWPCDGGHPRRPTGGSSCAMPCVRPSWSGCVRRRGGGKRSPPGHGRSWPGRRRRDRTSVVEGKSGGACGSGDGRST